MQKYLQKNVKRYWQCSKAMVKYISLTAKAGSEGTSKKCHEPWKLHSVRNLVKEKWNSQNQVQSEKIGKKLCKKVSDNSKNNGKQAKTQSVRANQTDIRGK